MSGSWSFECNLHFDGGLKMKHLNVQNDYDTKSGIRGQCTLGQNRIKGEKVFLFPKRL